MRRRPNAFTALLLALALLAGAAPGAWAQNAGDDQYSDPFRDEPSQQQGQQQQNQQSQQAPQSQAPSESVQQGGTSGDDSQAAPSQNATPRTLPVTGAPAALAGCAGLALLGAGSALRRRL